MGGYGSFSYNQRGADELVHRAFKNSGFEEMPFQHFIPISAFHYTMLLGFFLFEAFMESVSESVVPVMSSPTTLRRQLVDVASKIITPAGRTVFKITTVAMDSLGIRELWERCLCAPHFA